MRTRLLNPALSSILVPLVVLIANGFAIFPCTLTAQDPKKPSERNPAAVSPKTDQQAAKKISVGDRAPDFEIPQLGTDLLKLSEHVRKSEGPTILLFDRAHW